MILSIDPHSGVPAYRQVVDQIRFHVAGGWLEPGEEIPSTRALSAKLGLNPMTVSKAFRVLEEQGVLARRAGLPHVVADRPRSEVTADAREQLAGALRPVVAMARQLGVPAEDVAEVLRALLETEA